MPVTIKPHHSPTLFHTAPMQRELENRWRLQAELRAEIRDEDKITAEDRPFQEAMNRNRRTIAAMASKYLEANGFTSTGKKKG